MARKPKRDKTEILTRTEKWPLELLPEEEKLLLRVSDSEREWFNWALEIEQSNWTNYKAAEDAGQESNAPKFLNSFALYKEWVPVRERDAASNLFRARVPANWVLETFKSVEGAYKSFFALIRNGDLDARPPNPRPEWRFQVIPGCSAFSIKGERVVLAPDIFGKENLSFPLPEKYQARMLDRRVRLQKFIISRSEPDLRKPGQLCISISYEIAKPEERPFVPEDAVYVALGASSIGIISPKGEEVIELGRPDVYWKPLVDAVETWLEFKGWGTNFFSITKGSKKWRKLKGKQRHMYGIMADQQKLNRRTVVAGLIDHKVIGQEVVKRLRGHGVHFVLTDMVIRSKEGKLADAQKPERSGALGLNWAAQNTGSMGYLAQWLGIKVPEFGGTVRKHRLPPEALVTDLRPLLRGGLLHGHS